MKSEPSSMEEWRMEVGVLSPAVIELWAGLVVLAMGDAESWEALASVIAAPEYEVVMARGDARQRALVDGAEFNARRRVELADYKAALRSVSEMDYQRMVQGGWDYDEG